MLHDIEHEFVREIGGEFFVNVYFVYLKSIVLCPKTWVIIFLLKVETYSW